VEQRLAHYTNSKKMKGFRHIIQDEQDVDFMLRPDFMRGVGLLKQFGFTYDILIYPKHLTNTLKFVRRFPDQPFVIDHIAKPTIRENKIDDWKRELKEVANNENVFCKISGMVTEATWGKWRKEDFHPYLDTVVEMFGTDRLMYGSDWPVCNLSATYQDMFGIVADYFSHFSKTEQGKIFGVNASRFYSL
jgi:L-fuconolactonase